MEKIYVCEWSKPDLNLDNDDSFLILSFYDYTYHYNLEQGKLLANMKKNGYIIAKSLDPEDAIILTIPEKIQCVCVWAYENGEVFGKYDWNDSYWYYSAKIEDWEYNWKDMLFLPA